MKYKEVGQKIRDYRQKLDMTQQELADKIGVTWEMVSRYERGESSPFVRIEEISKALNTTSSQLLQKDNISSKYLYYEIPLFTSIPVSLKFLPSETSYYYTSPKWINELDTYVFALEAKLVKNNTLEIRNNGIVYISKDSKNESGIYLVNGTNGLEFTDKKNLGEIVGFVIAQEVRFK